MKKRCECNHLSLSYYSFHLAATRLSLYITRTVAESTKKKRLKSCERSRTPFSSVVDEGIYSSSLPRAESIPLFSKCCFLFYSFHCKISPPYHYTFFNSERHPICYHSNSKCHHRSLSVDILLVRQWT